MIESALVAVAGTVAVALAFRAGQRVTARTLRAGDGEAEFYDQAHPLNDPDLCSCGDVSLGEWDAAWRFGMKHNRYECVEGEPPAPWGPEWP